MNPIKDLVKYLMDSGPVAADQPSTENPKDKLGRLGFRAAVLDPSTFAIHVLGPGSLAIPGAGFVTGFERNGFFYTRTAAARAAVDWI